MSILPILTWPDTRLTAVCQPVDPQEDLSVLAADMLETMYDAPGRGLAAPQVGVLKRMFVMDAAWKSGPPVPLVFVNPEIVARCPNMTEGEERCLSIPGRAIIVARHAALALRWQGLDGVGHERPFEGAEALIVQHELDHLDGILTLHRTGEIEP